MSLTLLALTIAPFYLMTVLNPKDAQKGMKEVFASPGLRIAFSFFMLLLALVILSATGLESFNFESWESLLPWLGLIIAIKGTLFLLLPNLWAKYMKMFKTEHYPIGGFLGLLLVLFLVYVDTQLI